jgi:hypothetical protein
MSNNPLTEVYTMQEIAQLYGLSEGSLRYNIRTGKFQEDKDFRRSGRIILILKSAMEREYGKLK